jgi:hypothetical protein
MTETATRGPKSGHRWEARLWRCPINYSRDGELRELTF